MIILGIDPGSRNCGYGILQTQKRKILAAGCDVIKTKTTASLNDRLVTIYREICRVIDEYKPDIAAVETIFYDKNIKSAFTLGHARGVVLLALAERNVKINEYSPREVKKSVVGKGNATKSQIEFMVRKMLNSKIEINSQDAADALAIALCQFNKEIYNF